jgi:hypothetical protein
MALLRILAHHPLVVGVGDVFRELVFDLAPGDRRVQGLVDAADPLLFDRNRIDGGHLQPVLAGGDAGQEMRRKRGKQDCQNRTTG